MSFFTIRAGFVGETLLFLFIPLTLAYCVLTESPAQRREAGIASR